MTLDTALLWLAAAVLTVGFVYLVVGLVVVRIFWRKWMRMANVAQEQDWRRVHEIGARDRAFTLHSERKQAR